MGRIELLSFRLGNKLPITSHVKCTPWSVLQDGCFCSGSYFSREGFQPRQPRTLPSPIVVNHDKFRQHAVATQVRKPPLDEFSILKRHATANSASTAPSSALSRIPIAAGLVAVCTLDRSRLHSQVKAAEGQHTRPKAQPRTIATLDQGDRPLATSNVSVLCTRPEWQKPFQCTISGSFDSLSKVLFNFRSRYLFAIGLTQNI